MNMNIVYRLLDAMLANNVLVNFYDNNENLMMVLVSLLARLCTSLMHLCAIHTCVKNEWSTFVGV